FPDRFHSLGEEICREVEGNCKVVAVTGLGRCEGRTTLTLCLARSLAAKKKLAIIDADFANPCLAHQLGIGPESGWETVLLVTEQLSEISIQSVADDIALVPLAVAVGANELARLSYRIAISLAELADHYDLVLVDPGPLVNDSPAENWLLEPTAGVQGIILA